MKKFAAVALACVLLSSSGCDYLKERVSRRFVGPSRFFNMRSIKEPSTLQTHIIRDEIVESKARSDKQVRVIELTFVSQEWHGTVWEHPAHIYLPPDYRPDGKVGIIGTSAGFFQEVEGTRQTIPGTELDTEAEYAEGTALDLGMPIMLFATPADLIFGYEESDLMGYALQEMQKTQDLSWFPYIPIVTSYLRAITVMQSMPDIRAQQAVLLGCSKRGYSVCISTGVDPERVAGVMSTCYYGGNILYEVATKFASFGPGVRGPTEERMGPGFQPANKALKAVNSPAGFLVTMAFDPYIWRDQIKSAYLVALGTNDQFYSLGAPNGMMPELSGDKAFLYIDNMPHTWISPKHLAAWRMWLAHCFQGRQMPTIEVATELKDAELVVTARTTSPNQLTAVRLFHAYNKTLDWRFTTWTSIPMETVEGEGAYTASLALKENENLAWYVEVEDYGTGGPGYISSLVEILRY